MKKKSTLKNKIVGYLYDFAFFTPSWHGLILLKPVRSINDKCELYQKLTICQPGRVCQTSSLPECTVAPSQSQPNGKF